jgi:hypothetical protein
MIPEDVCNEQTKHAEECEQMEYFKTLISFVFDSVHTGQYDVCNEQTKHAEECEQM